MNNFFSTKQSWYDYGGKYDLLMLTSACKLESDPKKNMTLISILRAWLPSFSLGALLFLIRIFLFLKKSDKKTIMRIRKKKEAMP